MTDLQAAYAALEPIERADVARMNHLGDRGTFVEVLCIITAGSGAVKQSLLNVVVRETTRGRRGVLAGAIGPEFYDAD